VRGDVTNPRFRDLQSGVALGSNIEQGVKFVIQRAGDDRPLDVTVVPDVQGLAPMIGITSPRTTTLGAPPGSRAGGGEQSDRAPRSPVAGGWGRAGRVLRCVAGPWFPRAGGALVMSLWGENALGVAAF